MSPQRKADEREIEQLERELEKEETRQRHADDEEVERVERETEDE